MKIKDKITQSLASITVELQEISPDFYVIGASAMILSGIEVGETADIDILTTEMNSCKLQHLLKHIWKYLRKQKRMICFVLILPDSNFL